MQHSNEMRDVHNAVQAQVVNGDIHFHDFRHRTPHQWPAGVADIVNQLRLLASLDEHARIKVITGPRGSGKSTVALYWLCGQEFPDGQLYANLGGWSPESSSPGEILRDWLVALGMRPEEVPQDLAMRQNWFRTMTTDKAFGILLEDAVSAGQVRALLPGPGPSVVVVTGSGAFASLLPEGALLLDVEPLEDDMAVLLLRGFAGDRVDEHPQHLRELLKLCAGLPYALRLVGALLAEFPDLGLPDLMAEVSADDEGLAGLAIGDEPTLTSLFDAVYRRLSADAQRCYRAIGLHPGSADISPDALRAATGMTPLSVRKALRELALLRVADEAGQRIAAHGLVRAHGARLARPAERDEVSARLIDWYLTGAVAAESVVLPNRPWRRQLFPELTVDQAHPGIAGAQWLAAERVALREVVLLAHRIGRSGAVVRLCVLLWSLYEPTKQYDDLIATHVPALADARSDSAVLALLQVQLSFAFRHACDHRAVVLAEAALAHARGMPEVEATALETAGLAALAVGRPDRAAVLLERNLVAAQSIGEQRRIALACLHLAKAVGRQRAVELLDRAITLFRGLRTPDEVNVAKATQWRGRTSGDVESLAGALALFERLDRSFDAAQVLEDLGAVQMRAGDPAAALDYYRRARENYERQGFLSHAVLTQQRLTELV